MPTFNEIVERAFGQIRDRVLQASRFVGGIGGQLGGSGNGPGLNRFTDQTSPGDIIRGVTDAMRGIRAADTITAMQSFHTAQWAFGDEAERPDSSSADGEAAPHRGRRTTLADDQRALSEITRGAREFTQGIIGANSAIRNFGRSSEESQREVTTSSRGIIAGFRNWAASAFRFRRDQQNSAPATESASSSAVESVVAESNSSAVERAAANLIRQALGPKTSEQPSQAGSFGERVNSAVDRMFGRMNQYLAGFSGRGGRGGRGGSGDDDSAQGSPSSSAGIGTRLNNWLNSSSIMNRVRRSRVVRRAAVGARRFLRGIGGRVAGGMRGGAGGAGAAAGGGGIGGFFRGMFGGGGAAAGGAGGAAGGAGAAGISGMAVVAGFAAVAAAALMVFAALRSLAMQGLETAMRLSHLSGEVTAARTQLDVNRLIRDINTMQRIGAPAAKFIENIDMLERALRPITDGAMWLGLQAMNGLIWAAVEALKGLIEVTTVMPLKMMNELEKKLGIDLIPEQMIKNLQAAVDGIGAPDKAVNVQQAGMDAALKAEVKWPAAPRQPQQPLRQN